MSLQITQEEIKFAQDYRAKEIEAERLAAGDGVTVNKNVGKYSATTGVDDFTEHKTHSMSVNDFKSEGIVGSIGMGKVHDGAEVSYNGMTMTLGMAVNLGLVTKDANGNYQDNESAIKKTMSPQPKEHRKASLEEYRSKILGQSPLAINFRR